MHRSNCRVFAPAFLSGLLGVAAAVPSWGEEADLFDLLGPQETAAPAVETPLAEAPVAETPAAEAVVVSHNEPQISPTGEGAALSAAIAWDTVPATPQTLPAEPAAEPSLISDGVVMVTDTVVLVTDAGGPEPFGLQPPMPGEFPIAPTPAFPEPQPETIEPLAAPSVPAETDPLLRSILQLTVDTAADSRLIDQMATLPEDFAINDLSIERFGSWYSPSEGVTSRPPRFAASSYAWAAPAVYHRPLLFEQPNVERYGHSVKLCERDDLTQSAISAAHFFATVPVLPYKIGATGGFCEWGDGCPRNYVLGTYRPGSCNPNQIVKPRWSWSGLLYQGAATTGLVYLIP